MNGQTYNGWSNYETWLVNLWMLNEYPSACYYEELASSALSETDSDDDLHTRIQEASHELARQLKEEFEEACPVQGYSVWADLMNAAMGAVDWREIADHLVEAAAEDESEAGQ